MRRHAGRPAVRSVACGRLCAEALMPIIQFTPSMLHKLGLLMATPQAVIVTGRQTGCGPCACVGGMMASGMLGARTTVHGKTIVHSEHAHRNALQRPPWMALLTRKRGVGAASLHDGKLSVVKRCSTVHKAAARPWPMVHQRRTACRSNNGLTVIATRMHIVGKAPLGYRRLTDCM